MRHDEDSSNTTSFFINDEILLGDESIQDLIVCLNSCKEGHNINIHLNTIGGDLSAAYQIVNGISRCKGKVWTIADGDVMSAGSLIFFSGHILDVGPHCSFLLHKIQASKSGSLNDISSEVKHMTEVVKNFYYSCYRPYYSKAQIDRILQGEDLYETSKKVQKRVDRVGL